MLNYIKMKLCFYSLKKELYKMLMNSDEIISFAKNVYVSCEGLTGEELRNELIHSIAELAHAQAMKEREAEKSGEDNGN